MDLTFQNTAALVNTELLKAYSKMCPQLRELGIAVKRWAKAVPLATRKTFQLSAGGGNISPRFVAIGCTGSSLAYKCQRGVLIGLGF